MNKKKESAQGGGRNTNKPDVLKTEDMDEARRKWRQLCDEGKAKYFGFENGIYIVEGAGK